MAIIKIRTAGTLHLIGLLAIASPLFAGEYAVLSNGFRLHADRHERTGEKIRLLADGGVTELPASAIARFETEEYVPPPVVATAPMPVVTEPAIPVVSQVSPPATTPQQLAAAAAKKYSLPAGFVAGVMKTESGFQTAALSPRGAIGLMQLMPETARTLGVDPKNPTENAHGGAQYLRDLLARYEDRPDQVLLALAAYNAGPGAVEKYHGVPPYRETREYILRVLKNWQRQDQVEAELHASSK